MIKTKQKQDKWRIIFSVLAFAFFGTLSLKANYSLTIDGITYWSMGYGHSGESWEVTSCSKDVTSANILAEIRNGTVYRIDNGAFSGCSQLQSVTIPNSVTYIGYDAFKNCSSLQSVEIPNSVDYLNRDTFSGCSSLTSITIPNSFSNIPEGFFRGCVSLTSLPLTNSITTISNSAFEGCTGLKSIVIPYHIKEIGGNAFEGCSGLEEVTFEYGESSLKLPIDYHYYYQNGYIDTDYQKRAFLDCPRLNKLHINRVIFTELPTNNYNSIFTYTTENRGPFGGVPVKELEIGPKVNALTKYQFANMTELQTLTIPSTVNLILEDVFLECKGLKILTIEASEDPLYMVGTFGESGLEVLNLNRPLYEGNITVGGTANYTCKPSFSNSHALTTINFASNVKTIAASMFSGCTSLRSITIPSHITKVGDRAFDGCTTLKSINIEDADSPITIESSTNSTGEGTTFENAPVETIYLGRNVEYKGTELSPFKNLTTLTTLTVGNKTTDINNFLFYGCCNISMMSVPSSVKRVGSYAFYDCNQSRSLTISKSVTEIGEYAFYNCKNLKRLTIPSSVETIGDYAFRSCSGLETIKIGDGVKQIGNYAFLDCYSASDISLGSSVETIGNNAFYNCQAWKDIVIPNSTKSIGNDAFALCIGAASASIGDNVTTIGSRAFTDCEGLRTLTLGKALENLGSLAFFNCESLTDVYVKAYEPPYASEDVFSDYSATLHVPTGQTNAYKSAADTCWPEFGKYAEFAVDYSAVNEIGMENTGDIDWSEAYEVFDLNGVKVGTSTENIGKGIYIVRQDGKTQKIVR